MELKYNTQRAKVHLTEYGRGVQTMVEHLSTIEDREKRNRMARTIFNVMVNLNPSIKEQENYEKTVWDHMHEIGEFKLDIDSEYDKPEPSAKEEDPTHIGYKGVLSKYRFYGRNLLEMIDGVKDMEEGELKTMYINYIASFMMNSSKNWNDEDLTPNQIVSHLADLSRGKLQIAPDSLNLHVQVHRRKNTQYRGNRKKKNHNNKYKRRK